MLDRQEDPNHSPEVAKVEKFLSLRYFCISVNSLNLWLAFPVAV